MLKFDDVKWFTIDHESHAASKISRRNHCLLPSAVGMKEKRFTCVLTRRGFLPARCRHPFLAFARCDDVVMQTTKRSELPCGTHTGNLAETNSRHARLLAECL